jgi:hypothetical protein
VTEQEVMEHSSTDEIEAEVIRLEALKKQKKEIETEIEDIEKYLDKAVEKDITFENEDSRVTATVVRGTVDRFDEHLISTRYVAIWNLITKRRVDKSMYLDAMRSGVITPEMHKRFHATTPKKTYVLVTRNKRESE